MKYPKSVAFIISNEFCERFCFYGMRAILVLYLTRKLNYTDDNATIVFHIFTSLAYFFPILGAIVADSWLGRFRTIMYLSMVYMVGSGIIALGAIPHLHLPANTVTMIGLLLIAIGTGGIKPCVSAFGGDQFCVPEQAKQLVVFFSLFYMAINAGSLLSTLITPILREDVHCFGEDTCFSLAFGVPGALMVVSIFVFIVGRPFYNITKPSGNMLVMVSKCCYNAIWTRRAERHHESAPRAHWLDYAQATYGSQLVDDVKVLFRVLLLFVPLPIFWALFDQQGSRWTFQASRMDGSMPGGITIKPDQMQVVNPVLIIAFIPLWDALVYPALSRIGIRRPLQKLTIGMLLVAVSFVMSAGLELKLEALDPVLPGPMEAQLRVFNGNPMAAYALRTNDSRLGDFAVRPMGLVELKHVQLQHPELVEFSAETANHGDLQRGFFSLRPWEAITYFITEREDRTDILSYVDAPGLPTQGQTMMRVLLSAANVSGTVVMLRSQQAQLEMPFVGGTTQLMPMDAGVYDVFVNGQMLATEWLETAVGGVYAYVLSEMGGGNYTSALHTIVQPNTVHILWQLPQYVVVTAAEIMFSVTGLEFSFTEAPDSMKSVLQACWLLTVTVGNLIVVIIAKLHFFQHQSSEFLLFAGLMVVDMVLFMWLANRYRYNNVPMAEQERRRRKEAQVEAAAAAAMAATDSRRPTVPVGGVENSGYVNDHQ